MKRTTYLAALISGFMLVGANAALADAGCTALGGADVAGTCTVGPGVVPVSGTITVGENLVLQNGAHLDATNSGTTPALTLNVTGNLTMQSGSVIEADDDAPPLGNSAPAKDLTIDVTGNLTMAAGSRISADNNVSGGSGGNIQIIVDGNMSMAGTADLTPPFDACRNLDPPDSLSFYKYSTFAWPDVYVDPTLGARISAVRWGAAGNGQSGGNVTITVGNYAAVPPPSGSFTMDRCSIIDVSSRGPAGEIKITVGKTGDIDGLVLSESGQSGTGNAENSPKGGGPITVFVGCGLHESDTGVISSKGQDPGADLVLLKSCEVLIEGVVQSTAPGAGHVLPKKDFKIDNRCNDDPVAHPLSGSPVAEGFTACVRILAQDVTIDGSGNHNGNVNVDGIRAPMEAWIDIFATKDITILGDPVIGSPKWAVSGNGCAGPAPCSDSVGAVITIKAKGGKVTASGQAVLHANAIGGPGSDGGVVTIEAGGSGSGTPGAPNPDSNVNLAGSFIEANGLTAGSNTFGGTIKIKSYNGSISSGGDASGHIQALGFSGVGSITLTECSAIDTYLGTTSPAATENRSVCGGGPTLPADAQDLLDKNAPIWAACTPQLPKGSKSGRKFDDGTVGKPGLNGWVIHLFGTETVGGAAVHATQATHTANPVVDLTCAAGDGCYYFGNLNPGTYHVCEQLVSGWFQSFPAAGFNCVGADPNNDFVAPGPGPVGHTFTITDAGENETGNDFGNTKISCLEDPSRAALLTRTVGQSQFNGGSGLPGNPKNYSTVQAAYNDALASSQSEVVGLFANTTENLVLGGTKSLTITQCTVAKVTAAAAGSPVWNITSTGKLTIIGPDAVGGSIGWNVAGGGGHNLKSVRANGASVNGILITSSNNSVSWNDVSGNGNGTATAAGIRVEGGSNTLKGGTVGTNKGDGVQLVGSSNNLSGSNILSNTGNGVLVSGATNTVDSNGRINQNTKNGVLVTGSNNIVSNNASESGKGNSLNGIQVSSGTGNQLTGNKMISNTQAGINVAGAANVAAGTKLKSNVNSNNTGNEFTIGANNTDQGSNKFNGNACTFTAAAKNCI